MTQNKGKITQIVSAVVDVEFEQNQIPNILNALECTFKDHKITLEVAQHIGDNTVRCIAMHSTDGL